MDWKMIEQKLKEFNEEFPKDGSPNTNALYHNQQLEMFKAFLRKALEEQEKNYKTLLKDTADEDTEIRNMARVVLSEYEVYGDNYGVPNIADVVELLMKKIFSLQKGNHE